MQKSGFLSTRLLSNQSLTKIESKPISDVKAKPETIEKLSSLIRTRKANTATIPITKALPSVHARETLIQTRTNCVSVTVTPESRGRGSLVVNTSDSGSRGRGLESHSGRRVVSLSKTYLPPPPPPQKKKKKKKYW